MRTAAEVGEVALAVERKRFALRDTGDDLGLVVFSEALEVLHGFVTVHHETFDRNILFREFMHARFDRGEVFGRKGTFVLKVVVKAVFNGGSDRHFRRRIQFFDSLRHEVGGRVAQKLKPFGVLGGDNRHRRILFKLIGQIDELTVNLAAEGSLREPCAD